MSNLLKNLLIAFGLAVLVGLGYYLFIQSGDEPLLGVTGSSGQASVETQEFLNRLRSIQSIDVSTEIFSDARFTSLVDRRQQLVDEPVGRPNPFEAIIVQ